MVYLKTNLHLRVEIKDAFYVAIEFHLMMHIDALVSAKEFTKQFHKR